MRFSAGQKYKISTGLYDYVFMNHLMVLLDQDNRTKIVPAFVTDILQTSWALPWSFWLLWLPPPLGYLIYDDTAHVGYLSVICSMSSISLFQCYLTDFYETYTDRHKNYFKSDDTDSKRLFWFFVFAMEPFLCFSVLISHFPVPNFLCLILHF